MLSQELITCVAASVQRLCSFKQLLPHMDMRMPIAGPSIPGPAATAATAVSTASASRAAPEAQAAGQVLPGVRGPGPAGNPGGG